MNDNIVIVLVIAAVVALFVVRSRRRRPIAAVSTASIESSPSSAPPLTEEERLAQEAAEVQERWDRELRAVEQAHRDEMRPIEERLEKARQLVEKSGVGSAACDILRIMWHWPSWSKREDWKMPLPMDGLDGGETPRHEHGVREGTWLGWRWDGKPYRLELTVSPNYTGDDFDIGDLRLWVGEELVMHLDVSQRLDGKYDTWDADGVSALRAGPWMARLNDLAGRLRIADGQWFRDHENNFYGERAGKIDLD